MNINHADIRFDISLMSVALSSTASTLTGSLVVRTTSLLIVFRSGRLVVVDNDVIVGVSTLIDDVFASLSSEIITKETNTMM